MYREAGRPDGLIVVSERDNGISDAFNKGIGRAGGEIVAILNSDDAYASEDVFRRVIDAFSEAETLFVHGNVDYVDEVYGSNVRRPLLCPITTAMPYNHPTMFFRRSVYEIAGGFDLSYRYAMDYEFIIRCERRIPDFRKRGVYLNGAPLAVMHAGGASWTNELQSIVESKRALHAHGLWNWNARRKTAFRTLRTRVKYISMMFGGGRLVRAWRDAKWR
jgi:glycosyltransferase involved in cell wall biosynthesis